MVAALLGDDTEPALDQREVLAVLAEQHEGEPVVVEGEHDLASVSRVRCRAPVLGQVRAGAASGSPLLLKPGLARATARQAGAHSRASPNRLLVPTSVIVTGTISPISDAGAIDLHRLQIGRAADDLARMAAGLLEQHVERLPDAAAS